MAKNADDGPHKPDFAGAATILRTKVRSTNEKKAKIQGDLSACWKDVEDVCHVNKAAAKLVAKMLGQSEETTDDFLRSLWGLMAEMGIGIREDLLTELEEGEQRSMPTRQAPATGSALIQ